MADNLITLDVKDHITGETSVISYIKDIRRDLEINQTIILKFTTVKHPDNLGFRLLRNENYIELDGHSYRIKQISERVGYNTVTCMHEFSDLVGVQRYDYIEGSHSLASCLEYILDGTGWNYVLNSEVMYLSKYFYPENFGTGNAIKLLDTLCRDIFQIEFKILPNKVLEFSKRIGGSEIAKYEYGKNIKSIGTEWDTTSLRTYILGYYKDVVGTDEEGKPIEDWVPVSYTSPLASVYGIIEADPIRDSNARSASELLEKLERALTDEIKFSITVNAVETEARELGQTVDVIHPLTDGNSYVIGSRLLKLTESMVNNELVPTEVTIGNYVFGYFEDRIEDRMDDLEDELEKLKKLQGNNLWLSSFNVGDMSVLYLPGIDVTEQVRNNESELKGAIFDLRDSVDKITLRLKEQFSKFFVKVEVTDNGVTETYSNVDSKGSLTINTTFPKSGKGTIKVTVSEQEINGSESNYRVYFITVGSLLKPDFYLDSFYLGETDALSLNGIELQSLNSTPTAEVKYVSENELDLSLVLNQVYKDYFITVKVLGTDTTYSYGSNNYKFPISEVNTGLMVIVSNVPFEELTEDRELFDYQVLGVMFKKVPFEGLVTVKSLDEEGYIISTREIKFDKPATYDIVADEIDGYELVSSSPIQVELTIEYNKQLVEFSYKNVGGATKKGYNLEFITVPMQLQSNFIFSLEGGYDSIESVTLGIQHTGAVFANLAWEPISNGSKFTGIKVRSSSAINGAKISVQAVCYKGSGGDK